MAVFWCLVSLMEVYDLTPQNWGPRGVEFDEWARAWTAYRDRFVLIGASSLIIFVVLILAGLWLDLRSHRRPTSLSG